eukprot:7850627-Ditylum_brightwellii.AAC.1
MSWMENLINNHSVKLKEDGNRIHAGKISAFPPVLDKIKRARYAKNQLQLVKKLVKRALGFT